MNRTHWWIVALAMGCSADVAVQDPPPRPGAGTDDGIDDPGGEGTPGGVTDPLSPEAFCVDHPMPDDRIDCPEDTLQLDEKDSYSYCWVFEDGYSQCGATKDKKVQMQDMIVDVSCGVSYDLSGFPDKEDPDPEQGHPAVLARSSLKLQIEGDGQACKVIQSCCEVSPAWQ